jgi:hypothetical protein
LFTALAADLYVWYTMPFIISLEYISSYEEYKCIYSCNTNACIYV